MHNISVRLGLIVVGDDDGAKKKQEKTRKLASKSSLVKHLQVLLAMPMACVSLVLVFLCSIAERPP